MNNVVLILDPVFGERIFEVAGDMPIWVISSSKNITEIQRFRQRFPDHEITELFVRDSEGRADLVTRALLDIDEHFGSCSSSNPYQAVWVYGAPATDVSSELSAECGFRFIEQISDGFVARK